MKKSVFSLLLLFICSIAFAQKVDYKDGVINVDGAPLAKVIKTKNEAALGLISDYEIQSMEGKTLIIAVVADDYPEAANDNMSYYFKFSFVGLDKTGFFKVGKLNAEKSIVKLIGNAGIIKNGALDPEATFTFIAKQGKTPPAKTNDYVLVNRNKSWPIDLKEGKIIEQDGKQIGQWVDVTPSGSNVDMYEFALPSGLKIAKVSFIGGNNAQSAEVLTLKDNRKHNAPIPSSDNVKMLMSSIDRNQKALERIVKWMVQSQYL